MDPTGQYENMVTIKSFKPQFRLAGGLNLPKIIDCVGSDGKERRQLVKVGSGSSQRLGTPEVFISSLVCFLICHFGTESRLFTAQHQFSQSRNALIFKQLLITFYYT